MSTRWTALLLLLLLLLLARSSAGDPNWGSFVRKDCIQPGLRMYSSRLWDISGDWDSACMSTPAVVEGMYFSRPDRCVDTGFKGEWGEFYVRDTSCDPSWGSFKNDGCSGDGLVQYSSVLWNIQGSWEDWCARTPARVRGVRFPKPTRCVNTGTNEWGEFDVVDPCCARDQSAVTAPWLRSCGDAHPTPSPPSHGSAISNSTPLHASCTVGPFQAPSYNLTSSFRDSGSCDGDEERPPFPSPGRISTISDAINAFNSGSVDAFAIANFLWANSFRVIVRGTDVRVDDEYYALESYFVHNGGLSFQSTLDPGVEHAQIRALLIPTIPGNRLVQSGGSFPVGSFATVDVARPAASILCTAQLTGCCLAFGWDNSNALFYMGHVQPDDEVPAISNRVNMANYMRQNGRFGGVELSRDDMSFIGGDDDLWAYGGNTANVIGFVSLNCVYVIVQIVNVERDVVRGWMLTFCRR